MKLSLAKKFGLLAATALMMACSDSSSSSDADAVETDAFLAKLEGSYTELFPAMLDEKYNALWDSLGNKYAGDNAEMLVSTLKTSYILEITGEEAVKYNEENETFAFDCFFENGVEKFTFKGNTISGYDQNGKEIFSHEYEYLEDKPVVEFAEAGAALKTFKSLDENSGKFTYFAFTSDNPGETFHIEFRYGSTLDGLYNYLSGDYAYWLPSGIPTENTDDYTKKAIDLFISENSK